MAHLSHFLNRKKSFLLALLASGVLFAGGSLYANVIQFFDPTISNSPKSVTLSLKTFIANDPVSLEELFDDWSNNYHPSFTDNIALLDTRIDFGMVTNQNFYIGYFYNYNVFINTQKDFTDLFYRVKNKLDLNATREYNLRLKIEGIKQSGLMVSKSLKLHDQKNHSLTFGGAFYLSYGGDIQDGLVRGKAQSSNPKDYNIQALSDYFYTHNYLYDLDVNAPHGYGFGSHVALKYENKIYNFELKFLVNDLFSRLYWKNLPYSFVDIKTKNKHYDNDGYVKYDPSISGLEIYKDFTQKLSPKYKIEFVQYLEHGSTIIAGSEGAYNENFPYLKFRQDINHDQNIEFMFENRFGSFGLFYKYKNLSIGVAMDKLKGFSAFGLNSSFIYRF